MKILVTGSEGFIGKHLVRFLKNKGLHVLTFDLVNGQNLLDKSTVEDVFSQKIDYIIHLAAFGDVYKATEDPVGALISGAAATANLVNIASKYKVKKIIYVSTWEVYGKPIYEPIDENHPCLPFHPYSIAKYSGELIIRSVINKIPWVILRLGSVYGPNMRSYAVIPLFINKAYKKEVIILQGEGKQTRQFVHIDDICRTFLKVINSKIKNDIFNIVGKEIISIKQIAHEVDKYVPLKTMDGQVRLGDPINAVISGKKAYNVFNWSSQISIEAGISELISDIKSKKYKGSRK